MTKAFLILVLYGQPGVTMTTIPKPYPYEECKQRGQDFIGVRPNKRDFYCIIAAD